MQLDSSLTENQAPGQTGRQAEASRHALAKQWRCAIIHIIMVSSCELMQAWVLVGLLFGPMVSTQHLESGAAHACKHVRGVLQHGSRSEGVASC